MIYFMHVASTDQKHIYIYNESSIWQEEETKTHNQSPTHIDYFHYICNFFL